MTYGKSHKVYIPNKIQNIHCVKFDSVNSVKSQIDDSSSTKSNKFHVHKAKCLTWFWKFGLHFSYSWRINKLRIETSLPVYMRMWKLNIYQYQCDSQVHATHKSEDTIRIRYKNTNSNKTPHDMTVQETKHLLKPKQSNFKPLIVCFVDTFGSFHSLVSVDNEHAQCWRHLNVHKCLDWCRWANEKKGQKRTVQQNSEIGRALLLPGKTEGAFLFHFDDNQVA